MFCDIRLWMFHGSVLVRSEQSSTMDSYNIISVLKITGKIIAGKLPVSYR